MLARTGRRPLILSAIFTLGTAAFLTTANPADAGEPARQASRAKNVVRTVPVARTRTAIPAMNRAMTAAQLAAAHGLRYRDERSYVLLEGGSLRVRLYPGTSTVVLAGREYRVKDPVLRSHRDVVLSKRVSGFLNHKIGAYRADERVRARVRSMPRPRYEPLPPLPPRRKRLIETKRQPLPVRTAKKTPAPAPRADAKPDAGWAPVVKERKWKWIVLHHSDDLTGNVAKYDDYHRNVKRWEHGCGYHFVIGNGTLSGDGEVETGPRWGKQLHGAHAKTPDNRFNDFGIGICLVGDFDVGSAKPSRAQMDNLVRLVRWLRARYGIEAHNVQGHCHCCSTRCPGKNFPWAEFRRRIK